MKRICFVLMAALALAASGPAIAQQATTAQGQSLCRDADGAGYSTGAMTRGADGGLLRCVAGSWQPVPPGNQLANSTAQQAGQGSTTTVSGQAGRTTQGTAPGMDNVRLEVIITDQTSAGGQPIKKAMSLMLADRGSGRVRSSSGVSVPNTNVSYRVELNADAQIVRIEGDRIRVHITIEYAPAATEAQTAQRGSPLNQTVDVVLTSGKPLMIVESSDPMSDRKVSLTATATIVR